MRGDTTQMLQRHLDLLQAGEAASRHALIAHACERLRRLTRKMLRGYPSVQRWEQTDDVLQNAVLRLDRALEAQPPETLRHFFNVAAQQIRWELLDLTKRCRVAATPLDVDVRGETEEPSDLLQWAEFHQHAADLPQDLREIVDLLWYEGLTQGEAAEVLGISRRTVIRRWQEARVRLFRTISGGAPSDEPDET